MSKKLLKRVIATLCVGVMSMSCIVNSVGAAGDTKEAEVAFSLKYLEAFPRERSKEFEELKKRIDTSKLESYRKELIKHSKLEGSDWCGGLSKILEPKMFEGYKRFFMKYSNRNDEWVEMNEREVYAQIEDKVKELEQKVDDRTPGSEMAKKNGKVTKHPEMSRQMRVAKAIYRWVAKHIKYDWESFMADMDLNKYRRPQDALLTFKRKMGECAGKSDLTALMMRIAGIPSVCIETITSEEGIRHEYNAIYLEDEKNADYTGWVLLDTTWETLDIEEGRNGDTGEINDTVKTKIKRFGPAFYNDNVNFKSANEQLLRQTIHKIGKVFNCDPNNKKYNWFECGFKVGECKYELSEMEGKSIIKFDVLNTFRSESAVTIRPDIAKLGMKIKVGPNVRSLVLGGDETIDVSEARGLCNVDATKSKKYVVRDFKLYEKETNKFLCDVNKSGKIDNVVPYSVFSYLGKENIVVGCSAFRREKYSIDVKLPKFLTEFNKPVGITYGVESLILEGDEIVNLSNAGDLKKIDITNSRIYKKQGDKIVEKNSDKEVTLPERVKVEIIDNK